MRSTTQTIPDALVYELLPADTTRSIVMLQNLDNVNEVALQFGPSPGAITDFWQVPAGQTFTLDPATPVLAQFIQGFFWITSPTGNPVKVALIAG